MKAKDPICGMSVDTERPAATSTEGGTTVYFCSAACKTTFERRRASRPA